MSKFTLTPYLISVREARTDDRYSLGHLPESRDLRDVLHDYLQNIQNQYLPDTDSPDKTVHLSKLELTNRDISGVIRTGESGIEADLYDTEKDEISYTRQLHDAEMYPFYFLFHLRANEKVGIAILQRFRNFGIRTMLFRQFSVYFKSIFPNAVFQMVPFAETTVLRQFLDEGRLKKIRLIKYAIPSDKADALGVGFEEQEGTMSMEYTAKRNGSLSFPRLSHFLGNGSNLNELVELPGFEYDTIKIELDLNGTTRTVDLANPSSIRPHYDITDEVEIASNGFPDYNSVDEIAHQHLQRFLQAARLK